MPIEMTGGQAHFGPEGNGFSSFDEQLAVHDVVHLFESRVDSFGEEGVYIQIEPVEKVPGTYTVQYLHSYLLSDGTDHKYREIVTLWPVNESTTYTDAIVLRRDEQVAEELGDDDSVNVFQTGLEPVAVYIVPMPTIEEPIRTDRLDDLEALLEYTFDMLERTEGWENFRSNPMGARKFLLDYLGVNE